MQNPLVINGSKKHKKIGANLSHNVRLNPDNVLDFVIACPDGHREDMKTQKNKAFRE